MKTLTSSLISLFLITLTALGSNTANAYCVGWDKSLPNYDPKYYSVSHEFKRAKYVIEAKAIRETWLGEDGKPKSLQPPFQFGEPRPWGFDPYMGAYYDVEVFHDFKGHPSRHLRLFSENSTARFWLNIGKEYVLFVTTNTFDLPVGQQLTIDTCGNSKSLQQARNVLQAVENLSK